MVVFLDNSIQNCALKVNISIDFPAPLLDLYLIFNSHASGVLIFKGDGNSVFCDVIKKWVTSFIIRKHGGRVVFSPQKAVHPMLDSILGLKIETSILIFVFFWF